MIWHLLQRQHHIYNPWWLLLLLFPTPYGFSLPPFSPSICLPFLVFSTYPRTKLCNSRWVKRIGSKRRSLTTRWWWSFSCGWTSQTPRRSPRKPPRLSTGACVNDGRSRYQNSLTPPRRTASWRGPARRRHSPGAEPHPSAPAAGPARVPKSPADRQSFRTTGDLRFCPLSAEVLFAVIPMTYWDWPKYPSQVQYLLGSWIFFSVCH